MKIWNLSKTVAIFAPFAIQQRLFAGKTVKASFAEETVGGIEESKNRKKLIIRTRLKGLKAFPTSFF